MEKEGRISPTPPSFLFFALTFAGYWFFKTLLHYFGVDSVPERIKINIKESAGPNWHSKDLIL